MNADSSMREQGYHYFLEEAPELLQEMEETLFAMQESFSVQQMHALMRIAHTLKGASASLELSTIVTVAHTLEDAFNALCHSDWEMSPPILELLFQGYECLRQPLEAEFAGTPLDSQACIERTIDVVQRLETLAGDAFRPDAEMLNSADLGFDLTQSMFEVGVTQRLAQLEAQIASQNTTELAQSLQTHCSVFLGLAESVGLVGFAQIATEALAALARYPDRVVEIARLALADFEQGRAAVLAGDREVGGELSEGWQSFSDSTASLESSVTTAQISNVQPIAPKPDNEWLWGDAGEGTGRTDGVSERVADDLLNDSALDELLADESALAASTAAFNSDAVDIDRPAAPTSGSTDETGSFSVFGGLTSMLSRVGDSFSDRPNPNPAFPSSSTDSTVTPPSDSALANPARSEQSLPADVPVTAEAPTPDPRNPDPLNLAYPAPTTPSKFALPDELPTQSARLTSVRVQVEQLDRLNYCLAELLSLHNRQMLQNEQLREAVRVLFGRLSRHQQNLRKLQDWERPLESPYPQSSPALDAAQDDRPATDPSDGLQFDPLELNRYSQAREFLLDTVDDAIYLGEATEEIDLFAQASAQSLENQRGLLTNSRNALMDARMVPMGTILERLPRILKQLEHRYNKPASLAISGQQVLVEKAIVEQLYDPLLHLIRNAFDHGIEPATERRNLAKPPQGQIDIHCARRGSQLVVRIRDDGGGIDPECIRQRALESSNVPASILNAYSDRQLLDLLFQPGFTTTQEVSDISGRGVGLDVVRARLSDLQGQVTVATELGSGTTFTLSMPLNQTIETLLLCQVGYKTYAFLADGIEQVLVPRPDRLEQQGSELAMLWGEGDEARYIPIRPLAQVLPYHSPVPDPDTSPPGSFAILSKMGNTVLLMKTGETLLGIAVDRAIAEQELIVRPLGSAIAAPGYVCGGAVLADGRLALVVDGERLVTTIEAERTGSTRIETQAGARFSPPDVADLGMASQELPNRGERATILVIDDSLTQRMTVAATLEKAGYAVGQARNGREGLQRLQETPVDLILCDLEMPMMNGYEFLSQIKQTPALATIPVVMLTSRSSDKHRMAARELGAVGYLTKPCVDPILLSTVTEILQLDS